ncbi:MAG: GspE/PulE family protein, partial [Microcystaceae cyanobacterium]
MIHEAQDPSIVALVDKILIKALANKASEIQLEPQKRGLKVRFRQADGVMRSASELLPTTIMTAVINRVKLMAELDINQKHLPQDSKMQRVLQGQPVNFWVRTSPSPYGEKVVMHVLNRADLLLELDVLIRDEPTRQRVMDYDSILQSLLLQDVDVILVDRIREKKTAKTLAEAALTGRLVLTSLSSPDPISAIAHLQEMGLASSLIADTLIGVLNQRQIRRVCPVCRLPHTPSQAELTRFGLGQNKQATFYQANRLTPEALERAKSQRLLCPTCHGTGYQGQMGVYEVLRVTNRLQALIAQDADAEILKTVAVGEGMKPLIADALALATQGQTTLEEIERVFPNDLILVPSVQYTPMTTPPTNLSERLQAIEQLLSVLTHEFQHLKQTLESTPVTSSLDASETLIGEALPETIEGESLKRELESDKETLISDAFLYEELTDPGNWEDLKQELAADKQTITSDFQFPEALTLA